MAGLVVRLAMPYKAHRDIWYASATAQVNCGCRLPSNRGSRHVIVSALLSKPLTNSSAESTIQSGAASAAHGIRANQSNNDRKHPLPKPRRYSQ